MLRTKQKAVSFNDCGPTFSDGCAHEMDQRTCWAFTFHRAKQDLRNGRNEYSKGNVYINLNGSGARKSRMHFRKTLKENKRSGILAITIDILKNAK